MNLVPVKKVQFNSEFERRLSNLYRVLGIYLELGKDVGLAPALFKVFSAIWTLNGVRLRRSKIVLPYD